MKTLFKKIAALISVSFAVPALAFAQTVDSIQNGGQFIINFINTVAVPVLFAIAFIVFIYGVFQYFILGRGNEEKQGEARTLILYGLIGFFVMVSVWGLVNILLGSVRLNSNVPSYPATPSHP
jgi:NADH:ubiquinone oxidoreductase subunit 2 (subunit N)